MHYGLMECVVRVFQEAGLAGNKGGSQSLPGQILSCCLAFQYTAELECPHLGGCLAVWRVHPGAGRVLLPL